MLKRVNYMTENNEERNFYTTTEVLELLDNTISRATLIKYINNGKIKSVSFGKRKRLIPASYVNELLSGKDFSHDSKKY